MAIEDTRTAEERLDELIEEVVEARYGERLDYLAENLTVWVDNDTANPLALTVATDRECVDGNGRADIKTTKAKLEPLLVEFVSPYFDGSVSPQQHADLIARRQSVDRLVATVLAASDKALKQLVRG